MSLLEWPLAGVADSWSTMKAPLTLIFTDPGRLIVLSISAVEVAVRGRFGIPVADSASAPGPASTAPW